MAMLNPDLYAVRDRETLVWLDSGLEIVRAKKHEPISFAGMGRDEIGSATNKVNGSKFATDWTLQRYVDWLQEFLTNKDWQFPPSQQRREHFVFNNAIGIAAGQVSHTIEVVVRGRYVHAYPVKNL